MCKPWRQDKALSRSDLESGVARFDDANALIDQTENKVVVIMPGRIRLDRHAL
jgi:hypothetical protein